MADDGAGFLSRWSRRKVLSQHGAALPEAPPAPAAVRPAPVPPGQPLASAAAEAAGAPPPAEAPAPPLPTLDDVAALTHESDYARFVARGVGSDVRNAALRKLFSNPHFNVMDGLDTYIDDYNTPDPLPAGMLKQLRQSHLLGLFDEDPVQPPPDPDENTDLRLQPDDAAGRAGPEPGPGGDAGGQH
ncbi:DUF3306 domain-containing protein [Aquincola sp. MAHUQ-54]|uniref:DUF3306 domain-containing protein n=1 Tax=Aquincola agrisoli TaxID=3119538 RepID=A0AAW9QNM2_9BURK